MSSGRVLSKDQLCLSCLQHVRSLREIFLQLPNVLESDTPNIEQIQTLFRQAEEIYGKLEVLAEQLPDTFPLSEELQQLCIDYEVTEEGYQAEANKNKELMVESYQNNINYSDNYNMLSYCWEQSLKLEMSGILKKRSIIVHPEQVFTSYTMRNHPHTIFRAALKRLKEDAVFKRFGLWYKILDESSLGCVFEVTTGSLVDKQPIITQKTLVIENNGNIDGVIFVAPHEEWQYLEQPDGFGEHKVDVLQKSRFEVYRKLTAIANEKIVQYVCLTQDDRSNAGPQHVLQNLFVILPRYQRFFEAKCRSCGKTMNDLLPCVNFDPRNPSQSLHESCR